MIRRPPRSTRTDTSFPTLRASDLSHAAPALAADWLVNDTDGGPAILHQRDKRAEDRPPGDEAAGAVNRIENPDAPGIFPDDAIFLAHDAVIRSEEHTSELQSLTRNSYAVFCLKKKRHQ